MGSLESHDRKIEDRKMLVHGLSIFLSSIFLSFSWAAIQMSKAQVLVRWTGNSRQED